MINDKAHLHVSFSDKEFGVRLRPRLSSIKQNRNPQWLSERGTLRVELAMPKNAKFNWLREPEKQDYPAALSYLSLIYKEPVASTYVKKLKRAAISEFKAKDIFRASNLSLLGVSNAHVEKDRQKIKSGKGLSPMLLVRDSAIGKVIIADGYHRLCAMYTFDEDAVIPCKIV